ASATTSGAPSVPSTGIGFVSISGSAGSASMSTWTGREACPTSSADPSSTGGTGAFSGSSTGGSVTGCSSVSGSSTGGAGEDALGLYSMINPGNIPATNSGASARPQPRDRSPPKPVSAK